MGHVSYTSVMGRFGNGLVENLLNRLRTRRVVDFRFFIPEITFSRPLR